MQDPSLKELVERAAKVCGTKTELAHRLGVTPQKLSNWASGSVQMPPEQVAIVADIAGFPAETWLVRSTLLNAKGKPYEERLHKALGKWLPRTTGAIVLSLLIVGLGAFPAGSQAGEADDFLLTTMCILFIGLLLLIVNANGKCGVRATAATGIF